MYLAKISLLNHLNDPEIAITIQNSLWTARNAAGDLIGQGSIKDIDLTTNISRTASFKRSALMEIHIKLCHPSLVAMRELAKAGAIVGLNMNSFDNSITSLDCQTCLIRKLTEQKYTKGRARKPNYFGELISIDIKGPVSPESRANGRYVLAVTDHFSLK
jgi:hypothetical protein